MTNRLTKLSRTTFVPGIPYRPGIPARCYSTPYVTTIYSALAQRSYTISGEYGKNGYYPAVAVTNINVDSKTLKKANYIYQTVNYVLTVDRYGHASTTPVFTTTWYYARTVTTNITTCDPAVPEIPGKAASYIVDNQRGWTGGGRSRAGAAGNVVAEFVIAPIPTGVVCGLAAGGSTTDLGAIEHGIYASAGQFSIMESGSVVVVVPGISPITQPRIRISRRGANVVYTVGAWQYVSTKASTGAKFLQAALYVAGDYVDSPKLYSATDLGGIARAGAIASLDASLLGGSARAGIRGLGQIQTSALDRSLGGTGRVGVVSSAELEIVQSLSGAIAIGVRGFDRGQTTGSAKFGILVAGSSRAYAQGRATLPALTVDAYGGFPTVNVGGGQVGLPFYVQGDSKTGGIGGGQMNMPVLLRGSQGIYGEGRVKLPPFVSDGIVVTVTSQINTATGLTFADDYFFQPTVFMMIAEGVGIGDTIELVFVFQEDLAESLGIGGQASATFLLELLISSGLGLGDDLSQARQDLIQYATNIATGAVTRYSGFGFTSFCNVGQDLYGVRKDGLYKVGGATDNGELLSCLIDFAADDQGTPRTKRLENVFLGISSDGRTIAKLKDDTGREIKYRLIQRDSSEARIDPAKGVSSRYWHLRLEIEDATYADIDNIEWVAATGTRRTKR